VDKYFSDRSNPRQPYISQDDLDDLLVVITQKARLVPAGKVNKVSPDPDNDLIIGIAIKAKADLLVTENPKHIHSTSTQNSCLRTHP